MRARPIRPNIYKPLPRLGVNAGDWKYVGSISFFFFIVPVLMGLRIGVLPLGALTGPFSFAILVGLFNAVQRGKKPNWTSHRLRALSQRWARFRRALPGDYSGNRWLITNEPPPER